MPHRTPRCPICGNAGWHDRGMFRDCTHCELSLAEHCTHDVREHVARALPDAGRDGIDTPNWRLSAVALRNAAWALAHVWRDGAWRPARAIPNRIVLGVIGRLSDLPAIEALARTPGFVLTVAVLDGDAPAPVSAVSTLRLAMHKLADDGGDDFAAQRNRLQQLAETEVGRPCWVLQLDTDERPTPELLRALGWMTEAADADGVRSIGLPRRNLVDGALSALFPDIQYRLNRSDIRFGNRVHERPAVPFEHTTLGLAGCIEHRLERARVHARSIRYEALHPGAGRASDEQALLQPFDPAQQVFA